MRARNVLAAAFCLLSLVALSPATAEVIQYSATLSGAAEDPPNGSPGTGTALVTVDTVGITMRVEASFDGLLGTTTNAHIHCCTAAADTGNAGVATMTPTFLGFPSGVTSGSYDATFDMLNPGSWNAVFVTNNSGTTAAAFAVLLAGLDAGTAYFNVHSTMFGGGEIRGFLHEVAAVPEPGSVALLAIGLLTLTALLHRRRAVRARR